MIHEEISTYEVCKLAKEKGFNWICPHYFRTKNKDLFRVFPCEDWSNIEDRINAPTQSLLQRWLREEKRIEVNAFWDNTDNMWLGYAQEMDAPDLVGSFPLNKPFSTYELALEDAELYCLKNLL